MGAARRERRANWRRAKSKRTLLGASKEPRPWPSKQPQSHPPANGESADKLVLSALRYWEVKRDLIEERLSAIRSATAGS
jgi:hypothetical protein